MLIDFENTGYIKVCSSPDIIPIEEKNTYIPTSTWGYIRGDIAEQSDLMDLLANIEGGLTAEQISLLVNADDRLDSVERDIAALETSHEVDITHINTEISKKANIVDVYTKSEIDSKNYLTEHQSLAGYATENWVYTRGYISQETDPIWSAEKHKYALKSEIPTVAGLATQSWVNEQLTAKANLTDVYSKIEIDGKKYITAPYLTEQLTAKANLTDVYTKIEIDGKNFAPKDWVATELLAYAKTDDVYTKTEMDGIDFATQEWVNTQLLGKANIKDVYTKAEIDGKEYITSTKLDELLLTKANTTDVYTKVEIDGKNFATQKWTTEKLLGKANTTDVYTKTEMLSVLEGYLTPTDLTGYATESWVKKQGYLTEHQSLANYYTKSEVDTAIENVEVDLTGYATEDWVKEQNYLTEHQSLDNYYTKSEVDTAIENVEVDLTDYYTKGEIDIAIENVEVDLTGYATEIWVEQQEYVAKQQIWFGTEEDWNDLPADIQNSYIIAMIEL